MIACRARAVVALGACVALVSCSRLGPAGFWMAYHPECRVEASSDQGPWGGTRALRWAACGALRFSRDEARSFAEDHGWKLIDEIDPDLGEGGDTSPRFLRAPSTVLRFDSGWIRVEPGTDRASPAIGYVQVARDGSFMYVFHFWGEG